MLLTTILSDPEQTWMYVELIQGHKKRTFNISCMWTSTMYACNVTQTRMFSFLCSAMRAFSATACCLDREMQRRFLNYKLYAIAIQQFAYSHLFHYVNIRDINQWQTVINDLSSPKQLHLHKTVVNRNHQLLHQLNSVTNNVQTRPTTYYFCTDLLCCNKRHYNYKAGGAKHIKTRLMPIHYCRVLPTANLRLWFNNHRVTSIEHIYSPHSKFHAVTVML